MLAVVAYLLQPAQSDIAINAWYDAIAAASITVVWASIIRHRPHRRLGWTLIAAGFTAWVVGDLVFTLENEVLGLAWYPAPSDAIYLSAYGLLAGGLLYMVRGRFGTTDRTALLDASIIAAGAAVLAAVIVIQPLTSDASIGLLGKVVGSSYPIGDVLLLAMAMRLWSGFGAASLSHRLLTSALVVTLAADAIYIVVQLLGLSGSRWLDVLWLAGYVAVAAAASVSSMRTLGEPVAEREHAVAPRRRLAALTTGLMLPGVALVIDGLNGGGIAWAVVGGGTVLLSLLVVLRMSGLLEVVQVQAIQLAALASSDALTGAPNRRTWDHELSQACRESRDNDTPLCVAILDLDNFKRFNDSHGHQAGDLLLREAVAAWSHALDGRAMLARYGGEEFTVLLPGHRLEQATTVVDSLRDVMPHGQTFSAGVAMWDPATEPGYAVARADDALYVAKRNGRDRVVVHPGGAADPVDESGLPAITVMLQPLVDVVDGRVIGHEALCRFHELGIDPVAGFRVAHERGWGDLLEASAIRTAMELPGRPAGTDLYVNASITALDSDRFWALLPTDLRGIVVELNEEAGPLGDAGLAAVVERLRTRGARIALDDLGAGASELIRLAGLRPDVIKIDRGIVHGCADDPGRCAVISALVAYGDILGVLVCAEGLERLDDLDRLRELGITCVQGFLIAEPSPHWNTAPAGVMGRSAGRPPRSMSV